MTSTVSTSSLYPYSLYTATAGGRAETILENKSKSNFIALTLQFTRNGAGGTTGNLTFKVKLYGPNKKHSIVQRKICVTPLQGSQSWTYQDDISVEYVTVSVTSDQPTDKGVAQNIYLESIVLDFREAAP